MGSMDVAVVAVSIAPPELPRTRTPSPPPLPSNDELTERVPEACEFLLSEEENGALVIGPPELAELSVSEEEEPAALVIGLPEVAELAVREEKEPVALVLVPEPAELLASEDESPALVIGVHVDDSEDPAELVNDEDLETRPLAVLAPPMPYAGAPAQAADVRELLRGFQVAEGIGEAELRRELKALAGVDLTPGSAAEVVPR
jgi:hypothetical protein